LKSTETRNAPHEMVHCLLFQQFRLVEEY